MRRVALVFAIGCGRFGFEPLPDVAIDAAIDAEIVVPSAPSCATLAATCGPMASESCCAAALVPGGTFDRGYDVASDGLHTSTSDPATISPFDLDRFEITVGRFRAFVAAGGGTQMNPPAAGDGAHPSIPGSGWDASWNANLLATPAALIAALPCNSNATWTASPGANETRPINCVNWYEVMAFCAWDGGFLPTEAEWNFAAAGGDGQRAYPWSEPPSSLVIDCAHANYQPATGDCVAATIATLPVGTSSPLGDGRWGQADLAGNVWELVLDAFNATYPDPCSDCASLPPGATTRVMRGGGAHDPPGNLRGAFRTSLPAASRTDHTNQGARCARAP